MNERSAVGVRPVPRSSPAAASETIGIDAALAVGLGLLLFGVAILTWSGTFHSSDGLSMYAAADSLARYGRFDVEQIRWMDLQQGTYGPDGLLYSRKGLGTTVLIFPLALAGLLLPGIGPVHTALLLTPILTALSGVLLYVAGRRAFPTLPRSAPVLATLAWGVGSMAWPYSKTLFSDPIVALTMIGAFERFLALRDAESSTALARTGFGMGFWLALGLLTRAAHGIVLPIFGLALLWVLWQRHASRITHNVPGFTRSVLRLASCVLRLARQAWVSLLAFVLPLLATGLLALWYNWHRFGNPLDSGYLESESFSALWWRGIVGQLVSPGRGLLWYTPWLLLVVPAVVWAWRRARTATLVAAGSFLAYLLLYGKWYMWHGGFAWGPRFLVPALPLLAWLAVPAAARWRRLFLGLTVLGVAVNAIGVFWDFGPHQQWLESQLPLFDPRTFFELQYAQIPGVLRLAGTQPLDVLWMPDGRLAPVLLLLAGLVAFLGTGAFAIAWRYGAGEQGSKGAGEQWQTPGVLAFIAVLMVVTTWGLLWQARAVQSSAYHQIVHAIETRSPADVMIWHDDLEHTAEFLNRYEGSAPILGANVVGDEPGERLAERLPALVESPRPVWVVSDGPDPPANALDLAAMQHKGRVDEIAPTTSLRATYYFDTEVWQEQPRDDTFANDAGPVIRLASAGVASDDRIVAVRLEWQALAPIEDEYHIFAHVIGPDGERVAQTDGPAQNGLAPTSGWSPGESVEDVRAVRLSDEAPAGEYTVVVGLYRLEDLGRLGTVDGQDSVVVGSVVVR